jgi:hypothetical protein
MPRRNPSRRREDDLAKLVMAVVLAPVVAAKATRPTQPVIVHPVCHPAQTAAVAESVQTAMDEMLRKRRAERSGRS